MSHTMQDGLWAGQVPKDSILNSTLYPQVVLRGLPDSPRPSGLCPRGVVTPRWFQGLLEQP